MRYILIFLFFLNSVTGFSQTGSQAGWQGFDTIYQDKYITVELELYVPKIKCESKKCKWHARLTGEMRPFPCFLVWSMDYVDCNGLVYYEQNSITIGKSGGERVSRLLDENTDYIFNASSIIDPHYDIRTSQTKKSDIGTKIIEKSKDPVGIEGVKDIFMGTSTELNVKGGVLGVDGVWVWYLDECGSNKIDTGKSITVHPSDTTTYFVRAEGKNNITNCAQITVNVDKRSTSPNNIIGDNKICKGGSVILTVDGGALGLGAEWLWYKNECGKESIGKGKSITVTPTELTTYFVRAEGKYNKTDCAEIVVTTYDKSIDPEGIIASPLSTICEGQSVELKVKGGQLSNDADWKWYNSSCDGIPISTGANVTFSPVYSITYFVRGEGFCNSTKCVSTKIIVNRSSKLPTSINGPWSTHRGDKITLSLNGGELGANSEWRWYKGSCGTSRVIGKGGTIIFRAHSPTKYFVKAVGLCNSTDCISFSIDPKKNHHFDKIYSESANKFLHMGVGIGLEYLNFQEYASTKVANYGLTTRSLTAIKIEGIGIKTEGMFYPFMKDYLSFGFIGSYSIGTTPNFLTSGKTTDNGMTSKETYFYTRLNLCSELAFGTNPVKLLAKLSRSYQPNNYEKTTTVTTSSVKYSFTNEIDKEIMSVGVRLGRYHRKGNTRRSNNFDITYNLTRNSSSDLGDYAIKEYGYLSHCDIGFGFCYWRPSAFKLQLDYVSKNNQSTLGTPYFQVSFIFSRSWFY